MSDGDLETLIAALRAYAGVLSIRGDIRHVERLIGRLERLRTRGGVGEG